MKILLGACAVFLAAAPAALAQDAFLPPPDVVDGVLAAHPRVKAADARIRAAQAQARGLAVGPHEFEVSGSYMRRDVRLEQIYDEFDATVRRGVRLPGKAGLDRRAGVLGVEVAELTRDEARHETAIQLADLWFDWLAAAAETAVQAETVEAHEREVAGIRRRLELKDASALAADQAQVALETARGALAAAGARAQVARAKITALFPTAPVPIEPPPLPAPVLPAHQALELRDLAVQRDHEVRAAEREVERQNVLTRRANLDKFADPSLGVRLFSERNGDEWGGGVVASIPLGGARRSAAAEAHLAESRAAAAELAALTDTSRAAAESHRLAALGAIKVWSVSVAALDSARAAARRQRIGYDAGFADLSDLLYAERQAGDAARTEAAARVDATRAIVRMRIDAHVLWGASDHDAEG